MSEIISVLKLLAEHEIRAHGGFCFISSENTLSPLARIPLVLDAYSRYHFDHEALFGQTFFFGGIELGQIQNEYLVPLLKELSFAEYVDVRPISGLNCMTITMAALCPNGGIIFTIPEEHGGHMSSAHVANRLGAKTKAMLMLNHEIDLDKLEQDLCSLQPDLIYLDHSIQLFPIDTAPIRKLVDKVSPKTVIHYDSSHLNGLILAGALPNPLTQGAHSFGGSTHKTLPGPHKAFFATNDKDIAQKFDKIAYHFVSHHQVAGAVSLAITLMELKECGGLEYANNVLTNAQAFAQGLHDRGVPVGGNGLGFTRCHQVWVAPKSGVSSSSAASQMFEIGLRVNMLPFLPGMEGAAFRLSVAEITRLGAQVEEINQFVKLFDDLLSGKAATPEMRATVHDLRKKLSSPSFCYDLESLRAMNAPDVILNVLSLMTTR